MGKKDKKDNKTYIGKPIKNWREQANKVFERALEQSKKNNQFQLELNRKRAESEANRGKEEEARRKRFQERANYFREQFQKKNLLPKKQPKPVPNK